MALDSGMEYTLEFDRPEELLSTKPGSPATEADAPGQPKLSAMPGPTDLAEQKPLAKDKSLRVVEEALRIIAAEEAAEMQAFRNDLAALIQGKYGNRWRLRPHAHIVDNQIVTELEIARNPRAAGAGT